MQTMVVKLEKKILIGLFFFFTLIQAFPQDQNYFIVNGRVTTDIGRIDGVTITIKTNDSSSETITPPRTGRFRFEFDYNNEYELTFEKEDFFKKIIMVSTHVSPEVLERNNEFPPFQFVVNLFQELAGIDKSFTNKPVGRVFYNPSIDNFDSEIFFSDIQIEEQIEEAIAQNNELSQEQREINRAQELDLVDREKNYEKSIAEADDYYKQQEFEKALAKYQYAENLFPDRPYSKDRIAELQDLIAAMQLAENRKQEQLSQYRQAISQADASFNNNDYVRSRQFYEEALVITPGDDYAVNRIREVDQKIQQQQVDLQYNEFVAQADKLYRSGDLQQARLLYVEAAALKPGEGGYAQDQILKVDEELLALKDFAEKERLYEDAISEGEQALARQNYNEALIAFRRAAGLKENDALANQRITDTEEIILQQKNKDNYDQYITQADEAYRQEELIKAKSFYQEALSFLPDETYPKGKITEINQRVAAGKQFDSLLAQANEEFLAGNLEQAKLLFEQAGLIKDQTQIRERIDEIDRMLVAEELNRKYAKVIEEGDNLFIHQQYEPARAAYNQAIEIKSSDQYPKDQIVKIDQELALLANLAEQERQYQAAMADGSQAFGRGQYQNALSNYQLALTFKENDVLAQERIQETEKMLQVLETKQSYDDRLAQADEAFKAENWMPAKALYEQALVLLPNETYPQDQIKLIDRQVAQDDQFEQLVDQAQLAFVAENYQQARDFYQQALQIKDQDGVKNKIVEIDQILKQKEEERIQEEERLRALAAAKDKAYQEALDKGTQLLGDNLFDEARTAFQEAKEIKPDEFIPNEMIARVNSMQTAYERQLAEEKAREEARQRELMENQQQNYNLAIEKGNSLFASNEFELAKIQFETAASIKPEEEYPKRKLAEIEGQIAQLARLTISYNKAIDEANKLVQQDHYSPARDKYKEALEYLPDEEYPKKQIVKLDEILAQQEQEKLLEQTYLSTIQSADSLFRLNEMQAAKNKFIIAAELKPAERYPQTKIQEINTALAELARENDRIEALNKSYQEEIRRADLAFEAENYSLAKLSYSEALALLPNENYPKEQIDNINQLLEQQNEDAYQKAISSADDLYANNQFEDARRFYNEALNIKSKDDYATGQIRLINQKLENMAREQLAREELERSYQDKMLYAETAFKNSQYISAKENYQAALQLKPEELLPAQQIITIDSILVQLQQQEEITQLYSETMKQAQAAFRSNLLQEAVSLFRKASAYKTEEPLPKQRIAEIEEMIAQQEEIARLAKMEEEQRLARLKARDEQYDTAIANADQAFTNEQFAEAKNFYVQSLNVKPDEQYPQTRISEIDHLIEVRAMAEMERTQNAYQDSLQKAQQEAYNHRIEQAEKYVGQKAYESAISTFQEAIKIWPEKRVEVENKISEIRNQIRLLEQLQANYDNAVKLADKYFETNDWQNAIANYEEALRYKLEENYPKERIRFIKAFLETNEANYAENIRQADAFFAAEDWFNAKDKYTGALVIKQAENYPVQQLKIVNQRINEMQEAQKTSQLADESYKEAISRGEQDFLSNQLSAARLHFEFALELKPDETYPAQKIAEIDELVVQREKEAELVKQQRAVDDQYRQSLSKADNLFKQEDYTEAKREYSQALTIKSEEDYPKNQIALINKLQAQREEPVVADAPVVQPVSEYISVQNPGITSMPVGSSAAYKLSDYEQSIRLADDAYQRKDYVVAQYYYRKAMQLEPDKPYPANREAEIIALINQSMKASELAAYQEAIRKADEEFIKTNYSISRFYYYQALEVKSWEEYPKIRIEEIRELTNSMLSQKEEQAYNDLIAKADDAYYQKELAVARSYYKQALGIKIDERYPKIKIKDIEKLVEQDLRDAENRNYRNLLAEGDKAMVKNQFSVARFYYSKALEVKSDDDYPKGQLGKIKQMLEESK